MLLCTGPVQVVSLQNPSTAAVGPLVLAAGSSDLLKAMAGADLSRAAPGQPAGERLPALGGHVLGQRRWADRWGQGLHYDRGWAGCGQGRHAFGALGGYVLGQRKWVVHWALSTAVWAIHQQRSAETARSCR